MSLLINQHTCIPEHEITFSAIRAQGAGGQNVNKVSSALHLRFDIAASSLDDEQKQKLLAFADTRISKDGIIIIKAQRFRTQEKNREDALARLAELINKALLTHKKRKATRPTKSAQKKRLDKKAQHGKIKNLRGKVKVD